MNLLRLIKQPLLIRRAPLYDGALEHYYRGNTLVESVRLGPNVVHGIIIHPDGDITDLGVSPNLLTNAGRDAVADALGQGSALTAEWMAMSNDATAPAVTDTSLTGELSTNGFDRDESVYAHTPGAATMTLTGSWTATGTTTGVHKMGLFTANAAGTLVFSSALSTDADLTTDDTLQVTDTITLS